MLIPFISGIATMSFPSEVTNEGDCHDRYTTHDAQETAAKGQ